MRNITTKATILSVQQSGENNRTVTLLTPDEGIVYATLFGGPKSRLRSFVSPFNSGTIWLYRDETKNSCKITDFDPSVCHISFNTSLFKTYAASLGAEIIIKSKAAGSAAQTFYFFNGFLDGMELSEENECRLGLIRFIWRYMDLLGVRPDTRNCCQCGKSFMSGKFSENTLNCFGTYSERDNGFVCQDCQSAGNEHHYILSKESLTYLEAVNVLQPKEVRKIIIDSKTLNELRDFCYYLIENACSTRFLSLKTGTGIL